MRQFLNSTEKATGDMRAGGFKSSFFYRIAFSFLFLFLISSAAFSNHHLRGVYYFHKYLGEGKFEITIKSYWRKIYVGNIYPRYLGSSSMAYPYTISKTLLEDGETIEHIQKQIVTYDTPGTYKIDYPPCCLEMVYNPIERPIYDRFYMESTLKYDPLVTNNGPQFHDFPIYNFEEGKPLEYNMEYSDPEGNIYEYDLYAPEAGLYQQMKESGFQVTKDGTILWENPIAGNWLVFVRMKEKVDGVYTGIYTDRMIVLDVKSSDGTRAPVFTPVPSQVVKEGGTLSFDVEVSDPEGQNVKLVAYGIPLINGAEFVKTVNGSVARGTFTWAPPQGMIGNYRVVFVATDDNPTPYYSRLNVDIAVVKCGSIGVGYSITAPPCLGTSNGEIRLTATGGYAPYRYSLDSGMTFQDSPDFAGLAAGSYTGWIRDAAGCLSDPAQIVLEEAPLPVVTLNLPPAICANETALELTGGSPAGGTYQGTGVYSGYFYPDSAAIGTHTIYYTYTDSNDCSNTASQQITVNEAPVAYAGEDTYVYTGNNGGSTTRSCVTLTGTATGGASSYTYRWSTGETTQSIHVCPTATTVYIFEATDALGCADTSYVKVTAQDVRDGNPMAPVPVEPGPPADPGRPDGAGSPVAVGNSAKRTGSATAARNDFGDPMLKDEVPITDEVVVYPNPVTDLSQVKITLKEADYIKVDLLDMAGKEVKRLYSGTVEAHVTLALPIDSPLEKKKLYICRVTTSAKTYAIKLMVR